MRAEVPRKALARGLGSVRSGQPILPTVDLVQAQEDDRALDLESALRRVGGGRRRPHTGLSWGATNSLDQRQAVPCVQ